MNKYTFYKFEEYDAEEGIIKGTLTSFGNEDRVGDIMLPGSLDKFVEEKNSQNGSIPMYYQHFKNDFLGVWKDFKVVGDKLKAVGHLDLGGMGNADKVADYIKKDFINGISVGIFPNKGRKSVTYYKNDKSPIGVARKFSDIRLLEASLVFNPMNEMAEIESYKSFIDFEGEIEDMELIKDGEFDYRNIERLLAKFMTRKQASDLINQLKPEVIVEKDDKSAVELLNERLKKRING